MEPVYEFKLLDKANPKYQVDEIWSENQRIYWRLRDEINWSPETNVHYARPLK
jgi:hypothetical protein